MKGMKNFLICGFVWGLIDLVTLLVFGNPLFNSSFEIIAVIYLLAIYSEVTK